MMTFISVSYFASFNSVRHKSNYVVNELACVLSALHKTLRILPIMRMKNWIYSIVARNSSSHLFHDDFDVCHILQALKPLYERAKFCPSRVTEISFCQNLLAKDQTRCFMMFSMPVGHSVSLSSLPCVANSVHHESFKSCIYSNLPETAEITFFMMTSMSVAHSDTFNPVQHKPNYLPTESL